jgi:non-ribosomal peptide synthase protein (TIGR01720 family)
MPVSAGTARGRETTNRPLRGRFLRELVPQLRQHASARLPDYMVPSVFTLLDALPLTPSGKVDRRALPAPDALRPELTVAYEPPRGVLEETLARIWMHVLGVDRVGAGDNFFELGGDSMLSIQVVAAAREAGIGISARDIFQHQTVTGLAAAAGSVLATAEQGIVTGGVPPTPIARWFFEQELVDAHHFNQAFMLRTDRPLDTRHLEEVLEHLATHHDALRLRTRRTADGWAQTLAGPGDCIPVDIVDLSVVPPEEQAALVEREAARVQASLDPSEGPIVRCALFRGGAAGVERLLVAIHHLAVDVISWGILLEDLGRGLEQRRSGRPVSLPPKTTSIREWSLRLQEHARSTEVAEQAASWLPLPWSEAAALPVDHPEGENTAGSVRSVSVRLDEEQTRAVLHEVPAAFNATVEDALLAALATAVAEWTAGRWLLLDLEGHGRESLAPDLDVSRTVGWFTAIHPVLLHARRDAGPGAALMSVKEQLRAVPGRGLPFGLARYLAPDGALSRRLAALPSPQVAFNYLGQIDKIMARQGALVADLEGAGPSRSPRGRRRHFLEISGGVRQGRLRISFAYSDQVHREDTIQRLADRCSAALAELIDACRSRGEGGYTESDLAEVGWSPDDVEELLTDMDEMRA